MKPEQLEKWRETRKKGRLRYVLVSGVLSYGLPMFIAITFFRREEGLTLNSLAIGVLVWGIGGAVFGLAMWHYQERVLRKVDSGAA